MVIKKGRLCMGPKCSGLPDNALFITDSGWAVIMITRKLSLEIMQQPDDETCGPTCLHAIYNYYGDEIGIEQVVNEVKCLETGGTLAVHLGNHALKRGYKAEIFTNNLQMFDPTWFREKGVPLKSKLLAQLKYKKTDRFRNATSGYLTFLENGGQIHFTPISKNLIRFYLQKEKPILAGLSATYLYDTAREIPETNEYHDIRGVPSGHFVVIRGYDLIRKKVMIADPYCSNPLFGKHYYSVNINRLIHAILLGIVTFDSNLLVIEPADSEGGFLQHVVE